MSMTRSLSAADRCDRCEARAYVRVLVNGTELLFCAHHAKKYAVKLSEVATEWHDETDLLYAQEKARTNA